jgi:hypothetical protein
MAGIDQCTELLVQTTPERIVLTRIRGEVERQLQESGAPEEIHEFLLQHWSRLMTDIFMAKGNQDPDWQAGWDTMNALMWSLAPKQGRKEATMLLRALPNLLARLQEGCAALGLLSPERDAFFERLAMLHAAVVRSGLQDKTARALGGDEKLVEDNRVDMGGVDFSSLSPLSHEQEPAFTPAKGNAVHGLPELKVGSRIRLRVGVEDKLLCLTWLSPMGGMYLFTNEEGLDAMTLTRARLEAKFQQGEAKLLA